MKVLQSNVKKKKIMMGGVIILIIKKTLGWKATETMSEEEKLDHYLAMLMSYCEDKYAYRVEIPEILSKIRGMIK